MVAKSNNDAQETMYVCRWFRNC